MLTEELVGKSLDDVRGMNYEDVMEDMGRDVVSTRTKCATLALTIMKSASERHLKEPSTVSCYVHYGARL